MKALSSHLININQEVEKEQGFEIDISQEQKDDSLKKALLNFIHQTIDAENLVILAGSGTSLTFNAYKEDKSQSTIMAPGMADLWNDCKKLNSSLFDEIMAITNYDSADNNIESLLSICDSHLILKAKSPDELEKIKNFKENAKLKILESTSFTDKVPTEKWVHHENFLRTLGYRGQKQRRLKLFTTNYDLAFETAASNTGMIVIDGFEYSKPARFNPSWFHYDVVNRSQSIENGSSYLSNVFHLYKLHGSVDWVRNTDTNLVQKGNPLSNEEEQEPVFIYPSSTKYQSSYNSPYLDMMSAFLNVLQKPKTALICIGFGFNDDHLNNAITMALRTNPEIMLMVVTLDLFDENKSFNSNIRKFLLNLINGNDSRIMLVDSAFSEFVDILPNRTKETPEEKLAKMFETVMGGKA